MSIPPVIGQLVARFREHRDAYSSPSYNEAQVRREFIDPMFKALGWDMDNEKGFAEQWKEVVHEDAIKVGGVIKAPDYCFRLGGRRVFFLEAKKPAVNLKDDPAPAYQLRRYAWTAKMPLSVLTDFGEFAVYDTRIKPAPTDKASTARVLYIRFEEYEPRWDEIAGIFSPESIQKGAYDKYVESTLKKRGTAEVDDAFLAEIEAWRKELAQNIALRNPNLTQRELNFAVQITIDRIVFLRICEDRGVEDYGHLQALLNGAEVYGRLRALYERADERYNSGLFHFHPEKDRSASPDTLTPRIVIDDKVLKDIFRRLYYPDCPYVFSIMPAEILGQVYERFLGSVIRLTAGHRAVVELKPDVRKAGGVYYTPTYVVDYIVRDTVGILLKSKTPGSKGTASKIRILDPACGSGSFLLGAFKYLLDWHLKQYTEDTERWSRGAVPVIFQDRRGEWRLTTSERKRILLNNIYGADIDPQAVEVTKLSLLLKVLEGESAESLRKQLTLFHERALPDLAASIKCGNSLIAPDYYEGRQCDLFDEEEIIRVNAFDWKTEFPEIMRGGGFDALIGNPPYGALFSADEAAYLRERFKSPANSLDSFILFMEKASSLLNVKGLLGYIVPSGWAATPSSKPLRLLFLQRFRPRSFVSLPFDVFKGAYIDTIIVTAQAALPSHQSADGLVNLVVFPSRFRPESLEEFSQFEKDGDFRDWLKSEDKEFLITCSKQEAILLNKIRSTKARLRDYVEVKRGVEVFDPLPVARGLTRPLRAFNGILQRYRLDVGAKCYVDYTPDVELSKPLRFFSGRRILIRQVLSRSLRLQAVLAEETFLTSQAVQSLFLIDGADKAYSLDALLGLLNSSLLSWYFRSLNSVARRDDFPKIIIAQTRSLPVPDSCPKALRNRLERLVGRMLGLCSKLSLVHTEHDQRLFQRQIEATDREIDRAVYEIYGLTGAEIAIIESGS